MEDKFKSLMRQKKAIAIITVNSEYTFEGEIHSVDEISVQLEGGLILFFDKIVGYEVQE